MSRGAVRPAAEDVVAIGATAVAFGALAALVAAGSVARVDEYAVDHWMPNFEPSNGSESSGLAHQFYPHLGSPLQAFCNLWTFPASAFVSAAVLAVCTVALIRRGRRSAALAWGAGWIAANVAEVVLKRG